MKLTPLAAVLALLSIIAGCASGKPDRPMFVPKVGMTKSEILDYSVYKSTPANVSKISTGEGTTEVITFDNPPSAVAYFDQKGILVKFVCFKYCQ